VSEPILFGASYSVYTRIARLALAEKAVAHQFEETDIFAEAGPSPGYLGRQPFARIPALEHDGFSLYETVAIAHYVDEAFPGPLLQPFDPARRARIRQIIGILDAYAYRAMVWDVFVERVRKPLQGQPSDDTKIAAGLTRTESCLAAIEAIMDGAPWLAGPGERPTLADLHAAPMIAYLRVAPEGLTLLQRHPRMEAWWERMAGRDSMLATPSPMLPAAA
jgi:glutathione S-transferase